MNKTKALRKKTLCLLMLLTLISCNSKRDYNLKIEPPFINLANSSKGLKINPSIAQVGRFENGVSVEIPENAFIDSQGNIIEEEVILTLKTYKSPAEIIASGIPMTYTSDETSGNFESAGMFQVSGKTSTSEVFIDGGKELIINYPSQVCGEYDFFQFQEFNADSTRAGQWKKLSKDKTQNQIPENNLDTFKLKFVSDDYPELEPLSTIAWKLATNHGSPSIDKNKWVLDQEWASIEISEPKYGFGDVLISDELNDDQFFNGKNFTNNKSRIITAKKPLAKIWTHEGHLIKTIDKVTSEYFKILDDKYLIIQREEGDYIYDLEGNKIGILPKSYNRHLAKSKAIIVGQKRGTQPNVFISDITGKIIKTIVLGRDMTNDWKTGIYRHFILTPKDELITNSMDGITIYDLEGNQIKQKKGRYSHIEYLEENTLLIEGLDGTLITWNFILDKETKPKSDFFDLRNQGSHYASHIHGINKRSYIVINEGLERNSKLWNYKTNSITQLDFHTSDWYVNTLNPDLIIGYNMQDTTYHIYDIEKNEDIIKILKLYSFNELGYESPIISEDKKRLIVNSNSHVQLFDIEGDLIKDFMQYDSLIIRCGFINNELVYTLSDDGIYRTWNNKGVEISSKVLKNEESIYGWQVEDKIITRSKVLNNKSIYNLNGDLILKPANNGYNYCIDSTQVLFVDKDNFAILNNLFPLEPNVYQLTLRAKDQEFITYVYLDDNDLNKINNYYTHRAKWVDKEGERQEKELKTIRSFRVNEFGIYNWDKIVNQANTVEFAADFNFDVPLEYSNITIFLITDINGPAVFKFPKDKWKDFSINLEFPNRLLAVLPDNKVAVFDDFDSIDFGKISKDKSYTFDMEIIDKSISNLMDLENVLN